MPAYPVILLAFFVLALLGRRVEGSWIAPATIWPVAWGAYAACTLVLVGPTPHLTPALLWILLNCAVFLSAAVFSRAIRRSSSATVASRAACQHFPGLGAITLAPVGGRLPGLVWRDQGRRFRPADVLSLPSLARIAVVSRATFEFGGQQQGLVARLLLVLAYTGAPFGGMYFRVSHGTAKKSVGAGAPGGLDFHRICQRLAHGGAVRRIILAGCVSVGEPARRIRQRPGRYPPLLPGGCPGAGAHCRRIGRGAVRPLLRRQREDGVSNRR